MTTSLLEYFEKSTQSFDEYTQLSNQPVIKVGSSLDYPEQEMDHSGNPLYWAIDHTRFKFKQNNPNSFGWSIQISCIKPGDKKPSRISFKLKDCTIFKLAAKQKDFIFCSYGSGPVEGYVVQFFKSLERANDEFFKTIKDSGDLYKIGDYVLQSCIYTKEDTGNSNISGIKFPEKKKPSGSKKELPCYCKEGCSLWEILKEPCGKPFNYVPEELNKDIFDMKDLGILEKEFELRLKNEIFNGPTVEKIRHEITKFNERISTGKEVPTDQNLRKKYAKYQEFLDQLQYTTEEDRKTTKEDYETALKEKKENENLRLCYGTINEVIPEKSVIEMSNVVVKSGYYSKTQNRLSINLIAIQIRYRKNVKKDDDIDDQFN